VVFDGRPRQYWIGSAVRLPTTKKRDRRHGLGPWWVRDGDRLLRPTPPAAAASNNPGRHDRQADQGISSPRIATNLGLGDVIIVVKGSSHSTDVRDAGNVRLVGRPIAMSDGNDSKVSSKEFQGACHRCGWRGPVSRVSAADRKSFGTGRAYGRLCTECIGELRAGRPPRQDTGARRQTDGGDRRPG
jgi:hypothetical protein